METNGAITTNRVAIGLVVGAMVVVAGALVGVAVLLGSSSDESDTARGDTTTSEASSSMVDEEVAPSAVVVDEGEALTSGGSIARATHEVLWVARGYSWRALWVAQDFTMYIPPGLDRPLPPGEVPPSTDTHLYGLLDDGRWFAISLGAERPCGHLVGARFSCDPWEPDDPWWVPAFVREPHHRGGAPVAVYGYLPPGTFRVVVILTDDSPAQVVHNDRIWATAVPPGAGIRLVGFTDENDMGILELSRVPPDGWWMTEFER